MSGCRNLKTISGSPTGNPSSYWIRCRRMNAFVVEAEVGGIHEEHLAYLRPRLRLFIRAFDVGLRRGLLHDLRVVDETLRGGEEFGLQDDLALQELHLVQRRPVRVLAGLEVRHAAGERGRGVFARYLVWHRRSGPSASRSCRRVALSSLTARLSRLCARVRISSRAWRVKTPRPMPPPAEHARQLRARSPEDPPSVVRWFGVEPGVVEGAALDVGTRRPGSRSGGLGPLRGTWMPSTCRTSRAPSGTASRARRQSPRAAWWEEVPEGRSAADRHRKRRHHEGEREGENVP